MKKILWAGLLIIVGALVTVSIIKGVSREGVKRNLQTIELFEDMPASVKLLIKKHPELAEHLIDGDIEFTRQNYEFIEYLNENPDIVKMVLRDPDPRIKAAEVFEKFIKDKQN